MQFAEALRYLLSLGHETLAIKLGLRNIELLLERLGNPQNSYPTVQIAGTNGKGSTASMLASICRAAGIKAGLYTSPHLASVTERVRVNGYEISAEEFARCASEVRAAAEGLLTDSQITGLPTFFEQVTAIALLAFKESAVELAILETGLGGRLDATTAVGAKLIGITPIGLDHEEYLGETIASIAVEKAATIRPGVTAIVAPQPAEAQQVILARCEACGVTPSLNECETQIEELSANGRACVTFRTKAHHYERIWLGLRGRHQVTNSSVALRLAESLRGLGFAIPPPAIVQGLETAKHPGRLELFEGQPGLLLDGAHNPSGARALQEYLNEFITGSITLIFGAMRDKRLAEMAEILFPSAGHLILTRPDNPRAATLDVLHELARRVLPAEQVISTSSLAEALRIAKQLTPPKGLVCVAGSLYLVGEVYGIRESEVSRAKSELA